MTRNTRHIKAASPLRITAEDAKRLVVAADTFARSCKVQKMGLHLVVDALLEAGGRSTLIHRILTAPDGQYKATIGMTPVANHVLRRCACFAAPAAPAGKARK